MTQDQPQGITPGTRQTVGQSTAPKTEAKVRGDVTGEPATETNEAVEGDFDTLTARYNKVLRDIANLEGQAEKRRVAAEKDERQLKRLQNLQTQLRGAIQKA